MDVEIEWEDEKISIDDERKMFVVIFAEGGDVLCDMKPTTLREAIAVARDAHDVTDDDDDDDSLEIFVADSKDEYCPKTIGASLSDLRDIEERGFVVVEHRV